MQPIPDSGDGKTWERVRARKFKRFSHSKRNTKTFYLLQHMVKCAECGLYLGGRAVTSNYQTQNGKRYVYKVYPPRRYYRCFGMSVHKLECRRPGLIKAEHLEEFVWNEVKKMVQHPGLIVAGIESLNTQEDDGWDKEIERAERELNRVQSEEDRAIRLYVSGRLDDVPFEKRQDILKLLLDQVVIDRDNNVRLTLGIPTEDFVSTKNSETKFAVQYA